MRRLDRALGILLIGLDIGFLSEMGDGMQHFSVSTGLILGIANVLFSIRNWNVVDTKPTQERNQ